MFTYKNRFENLKIWKIFIYDPRKSKASFKIFDILIFEFRTLHNRTRLQAWSRSCDHCLSLVYFQTVLIFLYFFKLVFILRKISAKWSLVYRRVTCQFRNFKALYTIAHNFKPNPMLRVLGSLKLQMTFTTPWKIESLDILDF